MPKDRGEKPDENELAAAREFGAAKKIRQRRPPTPAERRQALNLAQQVAEVHCEVPAEPTVAQWQPVSDAARTLPALGPAVVADAVCCQCTEVLGGQVRGVYVGGAWYCPRHFMGVRDPSQHPVARAVDCPTCHHVAVDFSGRNICPVCRSRAAQPLKRAS